MVELSRKINEWIEDKVYSPKKEYVIIRNYPIQSNIDVY